MIIYLSHDSAYYAELVFILCALGTYVAYPLFFIGISISPFAFTNEEKVHKKLLQIIEDNKFYTLNMDETTINSSMQIKFSLNNNGLVLKVNPDGANYTSRINELTKIFETKFDMTVISVENESPKYTTYFLEDTSDNFIDASKFFGDLNE